MAEALEGRKVAVLATDGVEQVELTTPWEALVKAGAKPQLISLEEGEIQGMNHMDKGDTFTVDAAIADVNARDFAALLIPGGVANPDRLRTNAKAVEFVKEFFDLDKPVAAICHAPWVMIEADVLRGRTITSWPSLKTDVLNAGGEWVDKTVQVDQRLVTSRKPDDLPAFCKKMVEVFTTAEAESVVDEASEESFPASDAPAWGGASIAKGRRDDEARA
ncbi:MAG TPA: type 1 glutamine amidotransferase domain-containing protein [Gemmatimonadaceae bacterium]|nr:type 1 glutamine amidotransferase domain-containing protein [Gemmatimonadaceae bacterium]